MVPTFGVHPITLEGSNSFLLHRLMTLVVTQTELGSKVPSVEGIISFNMDFFGSHCRDKKKYLLILIEKGKILISFQKFITQHIDVQQSTCISVKQTIEMVKYSNI